MKYVSYYLSPLGVIRMSYDNDALTELCFDDNAIIENEQYIAAESAIIREGKIWLDRYFAGKNPGPSPRIELCVSQFRSDVSTILNSIPYGTTITYGEIAAMLGSKYGRRVSARAVGGAVGRNPVSIMIPCHRVMGAAGKVTGYNGGIERKLALLQLEGIDTLNFKMPG